MLKKTILLFIMSGFCILYASDKLNGAGASFPAPAYMSFSYYYEQETKNQVNYQSIGSGGGIKQVGSRIVDFGASDEPLKLDVLNEKKLLQFPTLIGSIVLAVNIDGIKDSELKLRNEIVAEIFLGKITKWNDPKIAKDNVNIKLPNENINVIRRSDGSGTTFNFTSYLSQTNKEWSTQFGVGKAIEWPTGIAAKGNEGVASLIKQTPFSIGYLENAYATANKLSRAVLTSKHGNFVLPNDESFKNAAKHARWNKNDGFYQLLILQDSPNAYPIVAATFILLPRDKQETNRKIVKFFNWIFDTQDYTLSKLGYIPLPDETKLLIKKYWEESNISPK